MSQTSTSWTYEEYALLPNDGRRHEIIDGEHHVNPAPNSKHQIVLGTLYRKLADFVEAHRLGIVFIAPYDVVLSESDIVQPDILFIASERRDLVTVTNLKGAPDLVIEILSDSNRRYDEIVKRKRYETFGVQEYWIVDPDVEVVKIHRLIDGAFTRVAEIANEFGGALTTPLLPGFSLDVSVVFTMP